MEPCKANTVGIVKNSSSLRTPRKTLQFFRACSGFFGGGNREKLQENRSLASRNGELDLRAKLIRDLTRELKGVKLL